MPQLLHLRAEQRRHRFAKFVFRCKSDPKEIVKIEPFLKRMNKCAKLDDGTLYRLLVGGTEAVNNAILHGNKSDPRKEVRMTCIIMKNVLKLRVKDRGKGFDPRTLPNPLDEENLMKESGRGVFLMRSLMDDVRFRFSKSGLTVELTILLKRS